MKLAAIMLTMLIVVPAHAERCPIPDIDGMRGRFGGGIPAEEDPTCMTALSYLALRLAQGAYPSPRLEDFDEDGRLMN